MKLCVLQPANSGPSGGHQIPREVARHLPGHTVELVFLHKATAVGELRKLAVQGFDVFINLCDGAWDQDQAGREVVEALEQMNVPFTGAASEGYELSKEEMKRIARHAGIATPNGIVADSEDEIVHAVSELRFPLIVKHPSGYDSIGMTAASRVETADELRREALRAIDNFGGALIEEFIEGREFTVLVVEDEEGSPRVYPPFECTLPRGESVKHFDFKWTRYAEVLWQPCGDANLSRRLEETAARYFLFAHAEGYERMDFRVDAAGTPFFLESNTNCSVFYPPHAAGGADIILGADPGGHAEFLALCMRAAIRRQERTRPRFKVRYRRETGYGLYALTPFKEGEPIDRGEEHAHFLVTATYAERAQGCRLKEWFHQNAWPIHDSVYAIWDPRPEYWKPINHSCDPNSWLSGLDLVARRGIAAGEQITMDYATFVNEVMPSFECFCGSPLCRKLIQGTDYLEPWLSKRYGDHLSPFVTLRRAGRSRLRIPIKGETRKSSARKTGVR